AYNLASQVLTSSPSHFAVVPSDEITTYFTGTGSYDENPETIFEIEQNSAYSLGVNAHPGVFYSNQGNHKGLLVRSWVYDLFDDTDLRQGLFLTAGTFASDDPTGYWTRKYPRNVGGNWLGNIRVFRMTEAKYIMMEALARKGDNTGALTLLNQHAAERGAQPYSGDALTAVLLDKQKEFLTEGHRFYDLKRNNLGMDKLTNCGSGGCVFPANSPYFVFPISLSERLLNPLLTQHPVWQ